MRAWTTRVLIAIGVLASIATSPGRWRLTAAPPPSTPTDSPAGGTQGLLVTVEASAEPEVMFKPPQPFAGYGNGINVAPTSTNGTGSLVFEYLILPGAALSTVELTGRGKVAFCGGGAEPKPPHGAFVRVVKTELVPTWHATAEESFHVTAGVPLYIRVDSPRTALVEASSDPAGTHVRVWHSGGNVYTLELIASGDMAMDVRARAHVYGPCRPDCAKPADEPLSIVTQ